VTFETHPGALVADRAPALLNTVDDRIRLLRTYGITELLLLPFDQQLMTTHWSVFLQSLMEAGAAGFVCGSDFRFGAGGLGTAKKLEAFCKKRQLPYAIVPQQLLQDTRVSSTHIRQLVEAGEMEQAVKFLGHPHVLRGTVVPGKQLGRTIGIPTANLLLPPEVLCPRHGVYACKVDVDGSLYMAVTNVGTRPTVEGDHVTVEPWILDFDGDLYGKTLDLYFFKFLRPEKKFDSLGELQAEIQKNAEETRKIFAES
jgi:riboflavin kinase/FMN adenylyltransferase